MDKIIAPQETLSNTPQTNQMTQAQSSEGQESISPAELGALAHLYRGEVYRSTIWRTRLDNTTNWSVVTLGIALSVSYSDTSASPLPLLLVGLLISVFLVLEARRYRYFNVWRARARWIETNLYAPMLRSAPYKNLEQWKSVLANDYCEPKYHISFVRALGRRLRRNYFWILGTQALSYFGKLAVHPTALTSLNDLWERAAVGPISGQVVVTAGIMFNGSWIFLALYTYYLDNLKHGDKGRSTAMG